MTFYLLLFICNSQLCQIEGIPSADNCEILWRTTFKLQWSGDLIGGKDHVCLSYPVSVKGTKS